jgi:FkbM family methyltransferase
MNNLNLIKILSQPINNIRNRETTKFYENGNLDSEYIVFGAGALGQRNVKGIKEIGLKIGCITDNNEKLWNTKFKDLDILSPTTALTKFPNAIVIFSIWSESIGYPYEEINNQLNKVRKCILISFLDLYWMFPSYFLPYWRCELPSKTLEQFELVLAAFNIFSDDYSKKEYVNQIDWRVNGNFACISKPLDEIQYFPNDLFSIIKNEIFLDCGAYDGDTLKSFLKFTNNSFSNYYAFEPDPSNFSKLVDFNKSLPLEISNKIVLENIGIGSRNEKIFFQSDSSIQSYVSEEGNIEIVSKTIDSLSLSPTFIKMDVEGFESDIIFGAMNTIAIFKPIIAISIYHKYDHLWRLPLSLNALNKDYDFYLRNYSQTGWELVCYAIPKTRNIINNEK